MNQFKMKTKSLLTKVVMPLVLATSLSGCALPSLHARYIIYRNYVEKMKEKENKDVEYPLYESDFKDTNFYRMKEERK